MSSLDQKIKKLKGFIETQEVSLHAEPRYNGAPWPDAAAPPSLQTHQLVVYAQTKEALEQLEKAGIVNSGLVSSQNVSSTQYKSTIGMGNAVSEAVWEDDDIAITPTSPDTMLYDARGLRNAQTVIAPCAGDETENAVIIIRGDNPSSLLNILQKAQLVSKSPPYSNYNTKIAQDNTGFLAKATIPRFLAQAIQRAQENNIGDLADIVDASSEKEAIENGDYTADKLFDLASQHMQAPAKQQAASFSRKKKEGTKPKAASPKALAEFTSPLQKQLLTHQTQRLINGEVEHFLEFRGNLAREDETALQQAVNHLSSAATCATPIHLTSASKAPAEIQYQFSEETYARFAQAVKKGDDEAKNKEIASLLQGVVSSVPQGQFSISTKTLDAAAHHAISQAAQQKNETKLIEALKRCVKPNYLSRYRLSHEDYETLAPHITREGILQKDQLAYTLPSDLLSTKTQNDGGRTSISHMQLHRVTENGQPQDYLTITATAVRASAFQRASAFASSIKASKDGSLKPEIITEESEHPAIVRFALSPPIAKDIANQIATLSADSSVTTQCNDERETTNDSLQQLDRTLRETFEVTVPIQEKKQLPTAPTPRKSARKATALSEEKREDFEINLLSALEAIIKQQEENKGYVAACFANITADGKDTATPTLYINLTPANAKALRKNTKLNSLYPQWKTQLGIDWGNTTHESSGTYQSVAIALSASAADIAFSELKGYAPPLAVSSLAGEPAIPASEALSRLNHHKQSEEERIAHEQQALQQGLSTADLEHYLAYKKWKDAQPFPPRPDDDTVESFDALLKDFKDQNSALVAATLTAIFAAFEKQNQDYAQQKDYKTYKNWRQAEENAPKPSDDVIKHIESTIAKHEKTQKRNNAVEQLKSSRPYLAFIKELSAQELASSETAVAQLTQQIEKLKEIQQQLNGIYDGLESGQTHIAAMHPNASNTVSAAATTTQKMQRHADDIQQNIEQLEQQLQAAQQWHQTLNGDTISQALIIDTPGLKVRSAIELLKEQNLLLRPSIKTNLANGNDVYVIWPNNEIKEQLAPHTQSLNPNSEAHSLNQAIQTLSKKLAPDFDTPAKHILPRPKTAEEVITHDAKSLLTTLKPQLIAERHEHDGENKAQSAIGTQHVLTFSMTDKSKRTAFTKLVRLLHENGLTKPAQSYSQSQKPAIEHIKKQLKSLQEVANELTSDLGAAHYRRSGTAERIATNTKALSYGIAQYKQALSELPTDDFAQEPKLVETLDALHAALKEKTSPRATLERQATDTKKNINAALNDSKMLDDDEVIHIVQHDDCLLTLEGASIPLEQIETQLTANGGGVKLYVSDDFATAVQSLTPHVKKGLFKAPPTQATRALTPEQILQQQRQTHSAGLGG